MGSSLEERVVSLEAQLSKTQRTFAETVEAIRANYDSQILELRQTLMLYDKIYGPSVRERDNKDTENSPSTMANGPTSRRGLSRAQSPSVKKSVPPLRPPFPAAVAHRKVAAPVPSSPVPATPQELPRELKTVIDSNQSRLNALFCFYTEKTGEGLLHPEMDLGHFSRLIRDCKLAGPSHPGCSPELLWMSVTRSLTSSLSRSQKTEAPDNRAAHEPLRRCVSPSPHRPSRSTLMTRGKYAATCETKDNFAFLRVEKIPKELFGHAMLLVWRAWSGGGSSTEFSWSASELPEDAARFDSFLKKHIFPVTAQAMERRRRRELSLLSSSYDALQSSRLSTVTADVSREAESAAGSARGHNSVTRSTSQSSLSDGKESPPMTPQAVAHRYASSTPVKATVKEFGPAIKHSYFEGIRGVGNTGMDVDDFFQLVRRYGLMPLITKPELKNIFDAFAVLSGKDRKNTESAGRSLTLEGYLHALYCLAEGIYAVHAVRQQYPSEDERIRKLLTKMFVLQQ